MKKDTKTILIILVFVMLIYYTNKKKSDENIDLGSDDKAPNPSENFNDIRVNNSTNIVPFTNLSSVKKCVNPTFKNIDISGRQCAGNMIDEKKLLKFGMQGCEVLLLQQRLNGLCIKDILQPNGQFNCNTLKKLRRVIGVSEITLNGFQPDEQTGFNELEEGKQVLPYSYMNLEKKKIKPIKPTYKRTGSPDGVETKPVGTWSLCCIWGCPSCNFSLGG